MSGGITQLVAIGAQDCPSGGQPRGFHVPVRLQAPHELRPALRSPDYSGRPVGRWHVHSPPRAQG